MNQMTIGTDNYTDMPSIATMNAPVPPRNTLQDMEKREASGTVEKEDTVELSEKSIRLAASIAKKDVNPSEQTAATANTADETVQRGRNESLPKGTKPGYLGQPVDLKDNKENKINTQDLNQNTNQVGDTNSKVVPGSPIINNLNTGSSTDNVLPATDTSNLYQSGNGATLGPVNNKATGQAKNAANLVPPLAPSSPEPSEDSIRMERLKTETTPNTTIFTSNNTSNTNTVINRSNPLQSGTETVNSVAGEPVTESDRTVSILKDRYRNTETAFFSESERAAIPQKYRENTFLQNVGSQIAQASPPANLISVVG